MAEDGERGLDPARARIFVRDKEAAITSHDLVNRTRREVGVQRVGHAGTLDPFATGLMVILVGRATRLQRYLLGLDKTYLALAQLGWSSDSGDRDGVLHETGRLPRSLALPTGTVIQQVPLTSAVRVDGERLYRRAHRGEGAPPGGLPTRTVEVARAELLEHDPATNRARYEIECSSGTYIRSLIETLDDAYTLELRRTAIGPIGLAEGERELSAAEALAHLPAIELDAAEASEISFGRRLVGDYRATGEDGPLRLLHDGRLIAVGRFAEGALRGEVVLEPAAT